MIKTEDILELHDVIVSFEEKAKALEKTIALSQNQLTDLQSSLRVMRNMYQQLKDKSKQD